MTKREIYQTKIDDAGAYIYMGESAPGVLTSTEQWQIFRINSSTGDKYYANGTGEYNKIWDNRTTYTYNN